MVKILGLGGVFFKCQDVNAYRRWWQDVMGLDIAKWGSADIPNDGEAHSVFGPFKGETDYFAPSAKDFMINLRVDDVQTLLDKAVAGGAKQVGEVERHDYGTFGWFIDPEGIKIELWQVAADT